MILSDSKSNGPQFSKIIVIIVGMIGVLGIIGAAVASIYLGLLESVAIAIIGSCGSIMLTTFVWFLKKSQVENNTKIYMAAYKDIAEFKYTHGEDTSDLLLDVEDKMIRKMDTNVNEAIDDGASLIEQIDVR